MPKGDNNRKLTDEQWAEVIQRYLTRNADGTWTGCKLLAKQYGVVQSAVMHHLHKAKVPIRSAKESHAHGKACKPVKNLPQTPAPHCQCGCGALTEWNQRRNRWNVFCLGHQFGGSKLYHNEKWLRDQYYNKQRTLQEIAKECGVYPNCVSLYAHRFGMILRSASETLQLRGSVRGKKNPAWKGGTSPERQRLYNEGHWRIIVKQIYARDSYKCQRCGEPKNKPRSLHAHHIKPWATNIALRFDLTNMITVCRPCHSWIHSPSNTMKEYLA